MTRLVDWEKRLQAVIEESSRRPFDPQKWNCCLFARQVVQALTGRLPADVWRGSIVNTVDGAGLARIEPTQAQRGDLVLADVPETTVGVCLGAKSAFVSPQGLSLLRTSRASMAWRV